MELFKYLVQLNNHLKVIRIKINKQDNMNIRSSG